MILGPGKKLHWLFVALGVAVSLFLSARLVGALLPDRHVDLLLTRPLAFNIAQERVKSSPSEEFIKSLERGAVELIPFPNRNLFEEWIKPNPREADFRIGPETHNLPLIYKGIFEEADGSLVAQVNFEGRSYFVKALQEIQGWKIVSLTKEVLVATRPTGETVSFPYRQAVEDNKSFRPAIETEAVSPKVESVTVRTPADGELI